MLLEPGQMQVWPAILLRMLSSPNDRFGIKKKTLLWIGASLRLYTDVFEDLFIFGTILYFLCFAIFISCYINKFLYAKSFQPFHPQFFRCSVFSGPPYILDKRFLYLDNCIFILILLYFLVFCFSPKLCRYCFSEVQLLTI